LASPLRGKTATVEKRHFGLFPRFPPFRFLDSRQLAYFFKDGFLSMFSQIGFRQFIFFWNAFSFEGF